MMMMMMMMMMMQVPVTTQSKPRTVFDHSNTGIMGLNSARGLDVCPRFSVLCCPV